MKAEAERQTVQVKEPGETDRRENEIVIPLKMVFRKLFSRKKLTAYLYS